MGICYNKEGIRKQSQETYELQRKVLALRKDRMSFADIALALGPEYGRPDGFSLPYVYKMYRKALSLIISEEVEQVRKVELMALDDLQAEVLKVLRGFHPLVHQGQIVRDFLEDENGNLILDEEGNQIPVKLQDDSVKLQAVNAALKIMERRARLLGLDAPTKVAATNPDGTKEASLVQFYLPDDGRNGDSDEKTS